MSAETPVERLGIENASLRAENERLTRALALADAAFGSGLCASGGSPGQLPLAWGILATTPHTPLWRTL